MPDEQDQAAPPPTGTITVGGALAGPDARVPTRVSLELTVVRADGTVEELGTVAEWSREDEQ